MSEVVTALNLDDEAVVSVSRANGEIILAINGKGDRAEAHLNFGEVTALRALLEACGALDS